MKISNNDILLTDSRDLTFADRAVFMALRTDVNDGHRYIAELYRRGVRRFIVDTDIDTAEMPDAEFMHVDSVLAELQRIAAAYRKTLSMPIVAITGSRGKTQVKELLYEMLKGEKRVQRSPRSYNSQIGVPLSVWEIRQDADVAIIEVGISQRNEMKALREIVEPTIGIFTSLTDEHDAGFDSAEGKAREKASLFTSCSDIYYPAGNSIIENALRQECPGARLHAVEGGNVELARAVARQLGVEAPGKPVNAVNARITISEALKNCLIIYDEFTNDLRSTIDALNFMHRRATASRRNTVILDISGYSDADLAELNKYLTAKDVTRFIPIRSAAEFIDRYTISDFSDELILIKAPEEVKTHLEAPRHETVLEVNINAIIHNFNVFRSKLRPQTGLIAMVKAAGYGTGALELAKTLQSQGAAYLAVAVIDEGVELRRAGITMPIIVMNPITTNYKALFDNRLEPSIFSMRELEMLVENARRLGVTDYPVHVKLDTGMHRLGFLEDELPELLEALRRDDCPLMVASVFSHLATADCLDEDEYTEMQLLAFTRMSESLRRALPYPIKRHILNTAGILRYPECQFDMVRLGIGLYGISPIPGEFGLETVATLSTTIISIKRWDTGTTIGYGRRGKIEQPSVIATIPIGYADGLNRHLSRGAASVLVNGHECPIVGNICMDQCMIDVTGANAELGDKVEIFGANAPITRLSDALDTIPYEVLTSVSPRVKRIYTRE